MSGSPQAQEGAWRTPGPSPLGCSGDGVLAASEECPRQPVCPRGAAAGSCWLSHPASCPWALRPALAPVAGDGVWRGAHDAAGTAGRRGVGWLGAGLPRGCSAAGNTGARGRGPSSVGSGLGEAPLRGCPGSPALGAASPRASTGKRSSALSAGGALGAEAGRTHTRGPPAGWRGGSGLTVPPSVRPPGAAPPAPSGQRPPRPALTWRRAHCFLRWNEDGIERWCSSLRGPPQAPPNPWARSQLWVPHPHALPEGLPVKCQGLLPVVPTRLQGALPGGQLSCPPGRASVYTTVAPCPRTGLPALRAAGTARSVRSAPAGRRCAAWGRGCRGAQPLPAPTLPAGAGKANKLAKPSLTNYRASQITGLVPA